MRPPEVFVRSLSQQEAIKLKRLSARAEHQSTRIRAAIQLASNVKTPVPQIARMWLTDEHVARSSTSSTRRGSTVCALTIGAGDPAGSRPASVSAWWRWPVPPDSQRVLLTRWSLDRRSAWLTEQGIVISPPHLGRMLAAAGLSFQPTRS